MARDRDLVESIRTARASRIVIAGVASGLLYVAMYMSQRALHGGPGSEGFSAGIVLYLVVTVGLFAIYVYLLLLFRRPLLGWVRVVALGLPVLYSLLWLPTAPVFSSDVLAYFSHGYVHTELDGNPYSVHSSAVAASPVGAELSSYGWQPVYPATPYGPLFTHLEIAVVRLAGQDVRLAMLLFKLVAVASSIATAVLIWWILDRVRPEDRDFGTLAYLWNPAVLVEVAGEGHNDSLMAMLALLAVGLILRRKEAFGAITMAGAALTKYLPLFLVPPLLVYSWRTAESRRRTVRRLAVGAASGLALAVVLFAPFWAGPKTLAGVGESARAGHTGSTQTVLVEILSHVIGEPSALRAVSVAFGTTLVLVVIVLALRVRTASDLVHTCALVMVIAMLVMTPAYWPWYVILPVALLALVPHGRTLVILVIVSLGSRLAAPLNSLYVDTVINRPVFFLLTWLATVAVPLLVLLGHHLIDFGKVVPRGIGRSYGAGRPDSAAV